MTTITSSDGTRIACRKSGNGPPLLLVHGMTADHTTTWRFVLPEFEKKFTVYAMDRRGRGGSGDAPDYALGREAEDIAAVVDSIGEPVNVLGHSYGALCAFEASLLTPNIRRSILYEGVYLRGADYYEPGAIDRLLTMLDSGDVEKMLVTFLREIVKMPPADFDALRSQRDAWNVRLANASTLPRELKADESYIFKPERFRNMQTLTLFLVGGESPPRELENARRIAESLSDARIKVLDGQQHAAMYTVPDVFVTEVVRFLDDK